MKERLQLAKFNQLKQFDQGPLAAIENKENLQKFINDLIHFKQR